MFAGSSYSLSPLKRAKELVDSVIVLMQHLTRDLEFAGGNCQLVDHLVSRFETKMAVYRSQGVQVGNMLSDSDMKLVEDYAEAQVQSFATDMEDMLASSVARCGLYSSPILHQGQAMQPKLALKSLPEMGAFVSPPLFARRGSGSAFSLPMVNGGEQQRLAGWTGMVSELDVDEGL